MKVQVTESHGQHLQCYIIKQKNINGWWVNVIHEPLVEPPADGDGNILQDFTKDEQNLPLELSKKLIMDKHWLKSMKFYTTFR